MGFWIAVGYFWAILMIIGGLILFPLGIVSMILGAVLIVYLQNSERDKRMEKYLKNMDESMNAEKRNEIKRTELEDREHDYKQKNNFWSR